MNPSAVYVSIDNVVPIDPDKAGKSVTDYLHDFGQITFFSLIAFAVLGLILAIVLAKKAGYSGWWGAIAVLFPPVGIILALLFALLKWPSLKERDEALGILASNDLTLPSHERKAIKESERKLAIEDAARKRMEKAQANREKADAQREKFAAAEAKHAADASAVAAAAAAKSVPAAGTTVAATKASDAAPVSAEPAKVAPASAPHASAETSKAAPEVAQAATADESEKPRDGAPGSVAPKVRTVRPRTSTNETTGTAAKDPAAPPEI